MKLLTIFLAGVLCLAQEPATRPQVPASDVKPKIATTHIVRSRICGDGCWSRSINVVKDNPAMTIPTTRAVDPRR